MRVNAATIIILFIIPYIDMYIEKKKKDQERGKKKKNFFFFFSHSRFMRYSVGGLHLHRLLRIINLGWLAAKKKKK